MANDLQPDAGAVQVTDDANGEALVASPAEGQTSCPFRGGADRLRHDSMFATSLEMASCSRSRAASGICRSLMESTSAAAGSSKAQASRTAIAMSTLMPMVSGDLQSITMAMAAAVSPAIARRHSGI